MNNEERKDIEDKINGAWHRSSAIQSGKLRLRVAEAVEKDRQDLRNQQGSEDTYVPINESEFDPIVLPEKKKHKGLKVTGLIAAMVLVAAGCAYAGVSYYYTNHFFEGTTINGINSSNKTAYEVEQEIASKMEDYSIEIKARDQDAQTIAGSDIDYKYVSSGEILKLLKEQKPYLWVKGFFGQTTYTARSRHHLTRRSWKHR